jgi:hypothetical protein
MIIILIFLPDKLFFTEVVVKKYITISVYLNTQITHFCIFIHFLIY